MAKIYESTSSEIWGTDTESVEKIFRRVNKKLAEQQYEFYEEVLLDIGIQDSLSLHIEDWHKIHYPPKES